MKLLIAGLTLSPSSGMSLIPDGFRIGESSMSIFNAFKPAPHFNDGIESRYGIGGSVIVSKVFPDFGLLRGPSTPTPPATAGQDRCHRGRENPPNHALLDITRIAAAGTSTRSIDERCSGLSK